MKIISLGLGVQSTALYYMSSKGELPRVDYAIFVDPGREKTETMDYLTYLLVWCLKYNGITIEIIQEKNLFNDLLNKSNSSGNRFASIPAFTKKGEGMLRRQCTSEYKIAQVDKRIKKLYGLSKYARYPKTEVWYGITLDEKHRMAVPQQKWKINVYPFLGYKIYFGNKVEKFNIDNPIRRSDLINWYSGNGLRMPVKSACIFCPYQSDTSWLRLKNYYPQDWVDAIRVDEACRDSSKKGIKEKIYLHRSCKPLNEVQFDETQTEIWGECLGNCHI